MPICTSPNQVKDTNLYGVLLLGVVSRGQTAQPFLEPYSTFSSGNITFLMSALVFPANMALCGSFFIVLIPGLCTKNALSKIWNS